MGGGVYSYCDAATRSASYFSSSLNSSSYLDKEVFTQHSLNSEMNVKGKIRESRDSDEHPTSFPIIIGLDVTGSMGHIPKELVTHGFPEIMKKIMDEGVEHAQVCFVGIGDCECDRAPIQVGQFETSDILTEKWLTTLYLEGGGGGNAYETYSLAWYIASRQTSIDSFEKRGKKGVLITIGDEPNCPSLRKRDIESLFGSAQTDIESSTLLAEAREKWEVYHINVCDWSGSRPSVINGWKQQLGENLIQTQDPGGKDIPDLIAGIIVKAYNANEKKETTTDTQELITDSSDLDNVVL